jgi:hypothetical protein
MADSNELVNSRRRFDKATYTPLVTRQPDEGEATDVVGRAVLVRSLELTPDELDALREQTTEGHARETLELVAAVADAESAQRGLEAATRLARVHTYELVALAERLHSVRGERIEQLRRGVRALEASYDDAVKRAHSTVPAGTDTTSERSPQSNAVPPSDPNPLPPVSDRLRTKRKTRSEAESVLTLSADAATSAQVVGHSNLETPHLETRSLAPQEMFTEMLAGPLFNAVLNRPALTSVMDATTLPFVANTLGARMIERAPSVMAWAVAGEPERLTQLKNLAQPYLGAAMVRELAPIVALPEIKRLQGLTIFFIDALNRRPLEPVGLLHLERLEMTPLEIERGELLYSLPLAPREKVTLSHKEWTTRQEQFERYIQDYLENYSERGVVEAEDVAMSSETQTRHANALSMSHATAANGSVTLSAPVDTTTNVGQSSVENLQSQQESKSQSRTVTAKASARTIKDHKVSFTVATVAGVEDFTARVIENPYEDRALRIDYFRRMRRWRSDLYRYGVRMTYDVVLPDPGRELRRRYLELQQIDAQLAAGFQFNLSPSGISTYNWKWLGDSYHAVLPAPPENRTVQVNKSVGYQPPVVGEGTPWVRSHFAEELELVVPDGWKLSTLVADVEASTWISGVGAQWITVIGGGVVRNFDANNGYVNGTVSLSPGQLPQSGPIKINFKLKGIAAGHLQLTATVAPTDAAWAAWQGRCWTILRDAAYNDSVQQRDRLRERRAALQRQIDAVDAVTLRRMEREQIMRLVLDWLFPGFGSINASGILNALDQPGLLDAGTWQQVMEYGEYIKFVHSAIDWDNVMVLLFPYFWDSETRQAEKLFFNHPDPQHREFIRAGAARVVLAIRPGFEQEVVSLLDQGKLGTLPDGNRFQKVVDDVQEANSKYLEMIQAPPNDVDETDNPCQPGILIGSWHDYTPTGALDIEVEMIAVKTNGLPPPIPHP